MSLCLHRTSKSCITYINNQMKETESRLLSLLTVLLLTVFLSADISAVVSLPPQGDNLEWHNLDVDGHRAAVFCFFKDSQGVVWAGTSQGLFLYDGVETHRVVLGVQVFAIIEHNDELFLGTNRGLVVYHQGEGKAEPLQSGKTVEIRCLLATDDRLLAGSLDGLYSYDFRKRKLEEFGEGLPHRSVYSLLRDSRGILYAGTYNGLARYDVSTSRFHVVGTPLLSNNQRRFINCMLESPDRQTIYLGTGEGLYAYEPAREQWTTVEGMGAMAVKSLAIDKDGYLLVGTYEGLYHLTQQGLKHYRRDTRDVSTPTGNQIWAVMTDSADNIWIGHERGLSFSSHSSVFKSVKIYSMIPTGESNEFLSVFRDSRGNLWLGGTSGVIVQKADGRSRWYHMGDTNDSNGDYCVRSVMEDSYGTVWLATDCGIYRYDPVRDAFVHYLLSDVKGERVSNWVYAICQMGDDLWTASYLGGINRIALSKLSGKDGGVTADFSLERGRFLTNDNISNMVADSRGRLWVLLYGDKHLYCYDTHQNEAQRYDILEMVGEVPTHICVDKRERLWCAFKGGALVYDQTNKRTVVRFPLSGSDESVLAMTSVDDGVWVSTVSNLWSVDGKDFSPSMIPAPQKGLTALCDDPPTGTVIAGWLDAIVKISKVPTDTSQNMGQVRMVLECVGGQVKNMVNLIGHPEGLSIPYGGSVSLLASTLFYSSDIMPHLEYRVIKRYEPEEDDDWVVIPEGSSMINLTGLGFGDYEIQIKVVSNPLPPAVILLHVGKPFWLSWWAFVLYFLLIAVITGAVIWYLRRRAIRRAQEREREEALASVEQKLAFLSDEKQDLETRIEQLLKAGEELTVHQRLQAITSAKPIEPESPIEKQLAAIAQIVDENVSSLELNGGFIGKQCGMSEKQLYRTLKKHLNVTPSEYIRNVRMQKAAMLLSQNYFTVSEVAYMVGFSAPSYFSKCFQDYFGMAPSNYSPTSTTIVIEEQKKD